MDFLPRVIPDPDVIAIVAELRSAQRQMVRQFVGHGLGAVGMLKRHAAEIGQNAPIDQEIEEKARHAKSHRSMRSAQRVDSQDTVSAAAPLDNFLTAILAPKSERSRHPIG